MNDEPEGSTAPEQMGSLALVIAPPGRLSDGWRALLLATPQIAVVRQVHDLSSVSEQVEPPAPDLVLLDVAPFGCGFSTQMKQIKDKWPHCRCVVLVCYARERQEALAAGADAVLIKGFTAAHLSAAIARLFESRCQGHTR